MNNRSKRAQPNLGPSQEATLITWECSTCQSALLFIGDERSSTDLLRPLYLTTKPTSLDSRVQLCLQINPFHEKS